MLFPTLKKIGVNGRWFLQIVDGDSWNLYPLYPLFPCSDFVSQMWGGLGGGGGVIFVSHFMLFPTFLEQSLVLILYLKCGVVWGGGCNFCLTFYAISNISRTKIWEYKPIISHLMFSSCFFCMLEISEKCPFTYSYWLNGRWFLQIVDIGHLS